MKKIFSILSLFVISISNILSAYTYANTWDDSIEGTEQLNINETESENTKFDDEKVDNITNDEFGTVLDWLTTWVWDSKQQPEITEEWDETVEQTTTEESKSDSETSETSETSEKSENITETLSINKMQDNTTKSTDNNNLIKMSNEIDWYACFWTTPEETDVNVVKYECDYTNIIVPDNISYIDQGTFAGKNINSITFLNNSTQLQNNAFSWATIIWDITLPWNQQYSKRALDNLIIDKSWVLTINKPTYSSNFKVYWKVIMDFSQWENSVNSYNLFYNSYIDWIVIFTWHSWEVWSTSRELFQNSELTEKWKIIFNSNITSIKGLFNTNDSWELKWCKWEIIFPNNINLSHSFNDVNFDYDWLIINNKFNIINNSFNSNMWVSRGIHWDIIANKISNSFSYTTINWNIIVNKNESNDNDDVLYNVFRWWTISWNVIISWDNMQFWASNFENTKIKWDFTFTWKNLNLPAWKWFNSFYISWDLKFYSDNLNVESTFQRSKVDWNLIFVGNENINLGKNVFSSSNVWNNVLISWNNVNFEYYAFWLMWPKWFTVDNDFIIRTLNLNSVNSLDNMNISWDIKINWWNLNLKNTFQNLKVWNNLIFTWNYYTWTSSFTWINIDWNLEIISNDIYMDELSFHNSNIWWDLKLIWNIASKSESDHSSIIWSFINSFIWWNTLISWSTISFESPQFFNFINKWDLTIIGDSILTTNAAFEDSTVEWNLLISWNYFTWTNWSFWNYSHQWKPIYKWDIMINSKNIYMDNNCFYKSNIWKNMLISGNVINQKYWAFSRINTSWDFVITWDQINIDSTYSNNNIFWDMKIYWNSFTWIYSALNNNNINWNLLLNLKTIYIWYNSFVWLILNNNIILNAKRIKAEYSSLKNLKIYWNSIISGEYLDFQYGGFQNSSITWDFNIYWSNLYIDYNWLLDNSHLKSNLRLPQNIELWSHDPFSNYSISWNLILEWAITILPTTFTLDWWLIIEDWDNAINDIFTWIAIWNKQVRINWVLSNIWSHSYSFKEWTRIVNTLTLSENFLNSNIWDWAFCIQNEPEVKAKAVTTKKFTEEEKKDLYDRTCIDLSYSWTHNLLLKVEWKEAIVVYDWINEVVIPEWIKKSWYKIEWFEDENLLTWTNINNQTFDEYEYQKTIYGKYVQEIISSSAWGGSTITPSKQETKTIEQEHDSAGTEKTKNNITNTTKDTHTTVSENAKEQVFKLQQRSLTRWEVAVMTNILLDVFPQLAEWKQELDDVENACSNYADEQKFTKDEKKAITRLCKLSIMWIHADNNKPLDEFMVNEWTKNNEFSKVINRSISNYNEKDFSAVKEALKKLEDNEENVEFWTVYNVFMSIKELFK